MPLQFSTVVWPQNSKIYRKMFKNGPWQSSMGNVLLKATITSFAKKLVMNLSLADRRESLSCKFFYKMTRPDSFIHHLIPQKRNQKILSRLSNPSQYCIFCTYWKIQEIVCYMRCALFLWTLMTILMTILLTFGFILRLCTVFYCQLLCTTVYISSICCQT